MSTERPGAGAASRFTAAVFPRIAGRSAELEREFEAARVRGYAAGYAEGMRAAAEAAALLREEIDRDREEERVAAQQRIAHAVDALEAAAGSLAEHERRLAATGQLTLESLAIELAEAVIGRELAAVDDSARAAVARILAVVDPADIRRLRLHPADLDAVTALGAAPEGLVLSPDAGLARGDAVADIADGSVDARIGAALDRARAALEGAS